MEFMIANRAKLFITYNAMSWISFDTKCPLAILFRAYSLLLAIDKEQIFFHSCIFLLLCSVNSFEKLWGVFNRFITLFQGAFCYFALMKIISYMFIETHFAEPMSAGGNSLHLRITHCVKADEAGLCFLLTLFVNYIDFLMRF